MSVDTVLYTSDPISWAIGATWGRCRPDCAWRGIWAIFKTKPNSEGIVIVEVLRRICQGYRRSVSCSYSYSYSYSRNAE